MIATKPPSVTSVQTANRILLALLLFPFLSSPLSTLPGGFDLFLETLSTVVLMGLSFRQPIQEFVHDSRFQTPPRLTSAVILAGLDLAMSFGLYIFVVMLLGRIFPDYLEKLQEPRFDEISGWCNQLLHLLTTIVIAPLYEEFVFRGVVLRAYEKVRSPLFAALLTAILFALFHLNLLQLIVFLPSAFILARAVQRRGSWWLSVICHVVNNGVVFGLIPLIMSKGMKRLPVSFSVLTSITALVIALVAFAIAVSWLRAFATEDQTGINKQEPIWTFSLKAVVLLATAMLFLTTFSS